MNAIFPILAVSLLLSASASAAVEKVSHPTVKLLATALVYQLEFDGSASPGENQPKRIVFEPSGPSTVYWGAQLSLNENWSIGFLRNIASRSSFENTTVDDYRFSFQGKALLVQAQYQNLKGLAVANSHEIDPSRYSTNVRVIREDLSIRNYGLAAFYVFSPDQFSLGSILNQSERQKSSGLSLIVSAAASQNQFDATDPIFSLGTSPFIPATGEASLTKGRFQSATLSVGVGGLLVSQAGFYLGGFFLVGKGMQKGTYHLSSGEVRHDATPTKLDGLLSTGFHGKSFFAGLEYRLDQITYATKAISIDSNSGSITLFLGAHF